MDHPSHGMNSIFIHLPCKKRKKKVALTVEFAPHSTCRKASDGVIFL
jgi:hypothetical protein